MKKAIIYLHGFNSASVDLLGNLLVSKPKLVILDSFCKGNGIKFFTPNCDYRNFAQLINDFTQLFVDLESKEYEVIFMGSSLGGFTSEYMAMKTSSKAIMINPAVTPSELLLQYIGVSENFEIRQPFDWTQAHCEQYKYYENELNKIPDTRISRTLLLDMADELIDSAKTLAKYQEVAEVVTFAGGSHGFEHMAEALPVIKKVIFRG